MRVIEKIARQIAENKSFEEHFYLEFQPQINTLNGSIKGWESLLRVRFSDAPIQQIVAIFERAGAIAELGEFVLQTACHHAYQSGWPTVVAVNVSPTQVDHHFVSFVEGLLDRYNIPTQRLGLEITECVTLPTATEDYLGQLQKMGVLLILDDLGVEYSSLTKLISPRFVFDEIKIDKKFIDKINHTKTLGIVKSIVQMAHDNQMMCVAEGVETFRQAALVEKAGCFCMQGFLFVKPRKKMVKKIKW